MNSLRYLRSNLYVLKKEYGKSIDLYKKKATVNIETGRRTVVRRKASIRRAIVMPSLENTKAYGQGFTSKGPGQGPVNIETVDRIVIVDDKDLPNDFDIEPGDYCIINRHRYEIKSVDDYESNIGYVLTLKETRGIESFAIIDIKTKSRLLWDDQALINIIHHEVVTSTLTIGMTTICQST
jgi:hypothetical protein